MKALVCTLMLCAAVSVQAKTFTPVMLKQPRTVASSAATPVQPQGEIASSVAVSDPMFGVHAKVLGLERRVEMRQWRKLDVPVPAHYEQVWSAEQIDSSAFEPAHRNAGELPFNGERWWTSDPRLDGHPVSADVMSALDAWAPLKPELSQLPTNLAVSFQPDGDWLSTSQDSAHPQIGDVRVRWRVIVQASAPNGTTLVGGRWELPAAIATAAAATAASTQPESSLAPASETQSVVQRMLGGQLAWWLGGVFVIALLLFFWKRRR